MEIKERLAHGDLAISLAIPGVMVSEMPSQEEKSAGDNPCNERPLVTLKEFYTCELLVYQAQVGAPVYLICECYKPCFLIISGELFI